MLGSPSWKSYEPSVNAYRNLLLIYLVVAMALVAN